MLRALKRFGFDQEELGVVYKCYMYVRPVLEYGDMVWHSGLCTKQIADLERIQRCTMGWIETFVTRAGKKKHDFFSDFCLEIKSCQEIGFI